MISNLLTKYPKLEQFCVALNPSQQIALCSDTSRCFTGNYPTLSNVQDAYGSTAAPTWLVPQLLNLSEFCGCKGKLTDGQLRELALILTNEYRHYKVSELMLFFYRFKAGYYGQFYGSVDPMIITDALRKFDKDRSEAIYKAMKDNEEKERSDNSKRLLTRSEYCKLKGIPDSNNAKVELQTTDGKVNAVWNDIKSKLADAILNNIYGKEGTLKARELFADKYNQTPEQYLKNIKK